MKDFLDDLKGIGNKIKNANYKKLSRQVANSALDGIRTTDKITGAVKDAVIGQVSDAVNHGRGFMDIAKRFLIHLLVKN